MKKMLINATQHEELRVAIVDLDTQKLVDLILERPNYQSKTGNIYLGKVTSLEPSLEAAFIYFGSERHGFLPQKEIVHEYIPQEALRKTNERPKIDEILKLGQEIMVQVDKEERGNKGAALTTFISLAGSYLVLMPNNPRAGGISRRIEGEERDQLRENLSQLKIPEGMGVIVRTAGVGKNKAELQWDLDILLKHWEAIRQASKERPAPFLIHQETDVVIRTIRDYFREDVSEIIIDAPEVYEKANNYLQKLRPDYADRVIKYKNSVPLFNHYQIENQIETAYLRELRLPSGGSIVIDRTEALVSIDINSARATRGTSIEETALNTNLEAAEEIARQLRLRDIGGLIVIDFIDMSSIRNQREVENHLRDALKLDRARVQVNRISRFGLLEMSRQRLRQSLGEATQEICPRCSGRATIRGVESLALTIIRILEEEAMKPRTAQVQAQLPVDVATYLLNEKRNRIVDIENRYSVNVVIMPNQYLQTPSYRVRRIQGSTSGIPARTRSSYKLISGPEPDKLQKIKQPKTISEKPAVSSILPLEPSPTPTPKEEAPGLLKQLWSNVFGGEKKPEEPEKPITVKQQPPQEKKEKPSPVQRKHAPPRTTGGPGRRPPMKKARTPRARRITQPSRQRMEPVKESKTKISEPTPEHLPPFPEDLENYYHKTVGPKQSKAQTAKEKTPVKKEEKPKIEEKPQVEVPKALPPESQIPIESSLVNKEPLEQIETKAADKKKAEKTQSSGHKDTQPMSPEKDKDKE